MSSPRYARQVAVPGIGERGQALIRGGSVAVIGEGLAAEVCALYLAGAGVGSLRVSERWLAGCAALNGEDVRLTSDGPPSPPDMEVAVEVGGVRHVPPPGAAVIGGARAARWALARLLSSGGGGA